MAMAKVLSTTSRAPPWWATTATAAMSTTRRSGLVGVSTHTIRVFGRNTRCRSAALPRCDASTSIPAGWMTRVARR